MTLSEKKELVRQFLTRCNAYADTKLAGYRMRLQGAGAGDAQEIEVKIGRWNAYREFNEYTIDELLTERLDDWFDDAETQ